MARKRRRQPITPTGSVEDCGSRPVKYGTQEWSVSGDVLRAATISEDQLYRYSLERRWRDHDGRLLVWVMLNPSTATGLVDDATIRRVMGFTRKWGYGNLRVVNLFAYRATAPVELKTADDPVGPGNGAFVKWSIAQADVVVAGWGGFVPNNRPPFDVPLLCSQRNKKLYCLGKTGDGRPRHPLYIANGTKPELY